MRGGRIIKISIFDIVVGDVIPLKIGDQVICLVVDFVLLPCYIFVMINPLSFAA